MITELRKNCKNTARCGVTGHYLKDEKIVRCPCQELEIQRETLGAFFCEDPALKTKLIAEIGNNVILEGTRAGVVQHVAGAFLHLARTNREWVEVHSQRLAEIWLGKDDDLKTTASMERVDLVFLWLGWGELPNKRLPECILELLARRWRVQKPLWVYMNFDRGDLATQYNSEKLARSLEEFELIELE